jgi:HEAT repeat protein
MDNEGFEEIIKYFSEKERFDTSTAVHRLRHLLLFGDRKDRDREEYIRNAEPVLERLTKQGDWPVKRAAIEVALEYGLSGILNGALGDEDPRVRQEAVKGLRILKEGIERLASTLKKEEDPFTGKLIIDTLRETADYRRNPDVVDVLFEYYERSPLEGCRAQAASAIATIVARGNNEFPEGDRDFLIEVFAKILNGGESPVAAIYGLGSIRDWSKADEIASLSGNAHADVRGMVAWYFGETHHDYKNVLQKLKGDANKSVREKAAEAIKKIESYNGLVKNPVLRRSVKNASGSGSRSGNKRRTCPI